MGHKDVQTCFTQVLEFVKQRKFHLKVLGDTSLRLGPFGQAYSAPVGMGSPPSSGGSSPPPANSLSFSGASRIRPLPLYFQAIKEDILLYPERATGLLLKFLFSSPNEV